ncbi:hypothetical protein [Vulcanisaeta souniana]|uniref:hypothetical protein n=1 Tax=Vulcanisaeta souniana TaxID=164452 RepID=UPI001FB54259|nr:hypothetical protein [Vulcanisaeta souniana]
MGTKHMIYAMNMVKEDLKYDAAAVIPYVDGTNNQLEVAERIRSYVRNLIKVALG